MRLEAVALVLGGEALLGPLSITIAPSEIVTVMGASGSGKSSLLAFLTGTLDPVFAASGRVFLDGLDITDLPPEKRGVGILFQDDLLFPHLSVGENLAFALPPRVKGRRERRQAVDGALAEAGLAGFADRDPATLSGGQRARAAVMRTLLAEPRALLLDEPFSKLDAALRERFREFVFDHARARRLPTLLVTHDAADARATGGPVIDLEDGNCRPATRFSGHGTDELRAGRGK
ncbi:MAG: ATP-binding cassette domain-containing protein [Alphaproteobacteria bacterium]|nr:ATP-binding cassette domain-containing protein [Alphaproteobacteria bacterium]